MIGVIEGIELVGRVFEGRGREERMGSERKSVIILSGPERKRGWQQWRRSAPSAPPARGAGADWVLPWVVGHFSCGQILLLHFLTEGHRGTDEGRLTAGQAGTDTQSQPRGHVTRDYTH